MADPRSLFGQQLVLITEIVTFMSDGHQVLDDSAPVWSSGLVLCCCAWLAFPSPLHVNNSSNNYQTEAGS